MSGSKVVRSAKSAKKKEKIETWALYLVWMAGSKVVRSAKSAKNT